MNEWLRENLVCPRDKQKLRTDGQNLICAGNHIYPVVEDIPVMLIDDIAPTHGHITETFEQVKSGSYGQIFNAATKNENQRQVNPYVQREIVHTCGNLYKPLINNLNRYPIPELRIANGAGRKFLDIGCSWGRWTIAAAQHGFQPVGIDPSLESLLAARKICEQFNVKADFVVGDSRYLPFADDCFETGFSYSVFQHFDKAYTNQSVDEIGRVLKKNGVSLIQMPNKYGVRQIYNRLRNSFKEAKVNDIRYWTPHELIKTFTEKIGATKISVDCYFGLNVQKSDIDLFSMPFKAVVYSSEFLRSASKKIPFLLNVADSLYLESIKR